MERLVSEFSDWLDAAIRAKSESLGLQEELTLGQITQATGIKPSSLSEMRRGITKKPKYENCLKLADYFGEDPNRVLKMAGHPILRASPVVKVKSIEIASPNLQRQLRRVAGLSQSAQEAIARMIGPIVDHVAAEEIRQPQLRIIGEGAASTSESVTGEESEP